MYEAVAVTEATRKLPDVDLGYWLDEYRAPRVETPRDFVLERRRETLVTANGQQAFQISGGIQLKSLIVRLRDGDVTARRDAVLLTRPDPQSLSWPVPLQAWDMTGGASIKDAAPEPRLRRASS